MISARLRSPCVKSVRFKSTKWKDPLDSLKDLRSKKYAEKSKSTAKDGDEVKSATEKLNEVRRILASSKRKIQPEFHFDPSNTKLDLTLSNTVLFSQIKSEAKSRTKKRFTTASSKWEEELENSAASKGKSRRQIQQEILSRIREAALSPDTVNESVSVGDLVTLSDDNLTFYLVVKLPQSLGTQSYTFVNDEGEITFGGRSSIRLRFPSVVPEEYHSILGSLVQRETKYVDIAPIGVSDDKFSRSSESLPAKLKKKSKPSSESIEICEEDGQVGGDFLVAQATSQFLTNSNVNTYQVPVAARDFFGTALRDLSIKANDELFGINQRLQWLHQILQYDAKGDVLDSPRTISVFELLHLSFKYDLYFPENPSSTNTKPLSQVFSAYQRPLDYETQKFHASKVLAFVTILRKHSRLYNIDKHSASFSPTSVTIIPRQNLQSVTSSVEYLKKTENMKKFVKYYLALTSGKEVTFPPKYYNEVIAMLKDYVIGNFSNDFATETCLASIVRLVDDARHNTGGIEYSYEYSRARAYQLLNDLELSKRSSTVLQNPVYWSRALKLPTANVSIASELSKEYFDYVNKFGANLTESTNEGPKQEELEDSNLDLLLTDKATGFQGSGIDDFFIEDRLQGIRKDFGNVPVYCIDSPDAHEVDDGVSIHELENHYVISTHVANPSSYIKPDSRLKEIAFAKGRTTYLPEQASLMLPEHMSKIAGLGIDGKPTRSFVVQYTIEKKILDDYLHGTVVSAETLSTIYKQATSTISVQSAMVHNFPSNFTYEKVNEVLGDETKLNSFLKSGSSGDVHFDNLYKMYKVATLFNKYRLEVGKGMQFNVPRGIVKVTESEGGATSKFTKLKNGYQITPANSRNSISISNTGSQGADSLSQLLVSELMIFANHSCATFARNNRIKVIYRTQDMKLHPSVKEEIGKMIEGKMTEEELSKMFSVLTSAKSQVLPKKHQSIGLDTYTNVTSPLRRYTDILNHWKFEDFLLEQAGYSSEQSIPDYQLQYISDHLQSMETVNTWAQRFSTKFWEGIFLREYTELMQEGKIPQEEKINFRLLIKSNPKYGNFVSVDMLGFNNLRCKLEIGEALKEMFTNNAIKVGSILEGDMLKISKVDFVEDEVMFEYK